MHCFLQSKNTFSHLHKRFASLERRATVKNSGIRFILRRNSKLHPHKRQPALALPNIGLKKVVERQALGMIKIQQIAH
jgi:hypothetical protein